MFPNQKKPAPKAKAPVKPVAAEPVEQDKAKTFKTDAMANAMRKRGKGC